MKLRFVFIMFLVCILGFGDESRGLKVIVKNRSGSYDSVSLYSKVHAVLIAIDNYPGGSGASTLSYAVKDAEGLKEVLKSDFKFNTITTLYNEQATRDNIEKTLFKLNNKNFSQDDALLIFFAGHGYTRKTKGDKLGYLIPYDGSFHENRMYKNIDMTRIRDYLSKELKPKHIFYIFDSCYSGTLFESRGMEDRVSRNIEYLRDITSEVVTMGLTAGKDNQQVLDGGPFGHSVFTGRLIEALRETDDFITAKELIVKVKEKVYIDAKDRG